MKPRARLLACLLVCLLVAPAAAQLTVKPSPGNYLGYVASPEPGKWLVMGPNTLAFVTPTVLDGGKAITWEGPAGTYAVAWIPPGDGQPIGQNVTLGPVTPPKPDPEPEPQPKPDPTPSDFAAKIKAAAELVDPAHRTAAKQIADLFTSVAAEAAANPSSWDPAAMANEVKTRTTSTLTTAQLTAWRPWWAVYAKAITDLKLSDTDLAGHIEAFRQVADALT